MFKLSEIKELIKLVDQTSVSEVEIENEGSRLMIRKPGKTESVIVHSAPASVPVSAQHQPAPQPTGAAISPSVPAEQDSAGPSEQLHKITSPMVGTYYSSPSPTSGPYVQKGDKVTTKSVVCIVEAMKLMNEIEAEVKGEIVDVLVENGQLVEYGQPLFLVRPE
jgi:acetyl-CoA carboxylase biotin carboxyl carrier protein